MSPIKSLPLSLSQQQVWLDQKSHPGSPHFNIGGIGWIDGVLDVALFRQALAHMVAESEALRLLPQPDGTQQLLSGWQGELMEFHDHNSQCEPEVTIVDWCKTTFAQAIPLDGKQRPWQIALLKQSEQRHAMVARFHHLIMDGYSVALAFRRWNAIYNAMLKGDSPEQDKPLYSQFIEQSNQYEQSQSIEKDRSHWHQAMPELPQLLLDKSQQGSATLPQAQHHYYFIEPKQYHQFEQFAKSLNATTFHLFIAALSIYFCRIYTKSELTFGLPILNRGGKRFKDTLGMFVGMIPFTVDLAQAQSAPELIGQINRQLKRAYRHARYPLSHLGRDLNMIHHRQDRLFDIVISFEIQDFTVKFGDASLNKIQQMFSSKARYPLSIAICEFHDDDPVEVAIESSTEQFTMAQTKALALRLHHLMVEMTCCDNVAIDTLPLLTAAEHYELIHGKHADVPEFPNPQPFILAFEHQAALRPDACAVRTLTENISYQTLNHQANRLAHQLIGCGIKPGDIVAVALPRQSETIVAFLAVAKARAAFVPIDPDAPLERIVQLIDMSRASLALVGNCSRQWAGTLAIATIDIECVSAPQYDQSLPSSDLEDKPRMNDLVYLLFTSGSTGKPKGVLMEHGPLSRRLAWLGRTFKFTPQDSWLQSIQLTFDPAMLELFVPLIRGGTLALAPPGQVAPVELAGLAESLEATCIIFVPTTLKYFNQVAANHPNLKLRMAISGGELLHRDLAMEFVRQTGAQIYNFYGPTEACIYATVQHFDKDCPDDPVPIGSAVDDTRIYILDKNLQPVPQGAVGEIYIGGKGLARGYLDNPQADQRFVSDPFVPGLTMYCSGDNGYYDDNGRLCFVGRIDNQIKLRGQRIEPGEIETRLCDISFVKAAAVKKHEEALHAWIVLNQKPDQVLMAKLRKALLGKLPGHMIPSHFTVLSDMPRQSSGKTDYNQLIADPIVMQRDSDNTENKGNDLENLLLNLWQEILPDTPYGLDSDFFAVGGNSLKALELLDKLRAQMGQRLPLSMLLHNASPRRLAKALIERHHPLMVNLSKHEYGTPVYLCASGHGDALRFVPLAKALKGNFHLIMLQPPELEGYTTYHTIGELAQYYADMIEHRHHHQPPVIAGFSVAGMSALETARRLISQGVSIASLVMIDTTYPQRLFNRPRLWRICRFLVNSLNIQHLSINQRTLGSLFNDPGLNGQIMAIKSYRPAPLSIDIQMIISSGFNRWYKLLFKPWKNLFAHHLKETHLDGFHGTLFNPEHVEGVAKVIQKSTQKSVGISNTP